MIYTFIVYIFVVMFLFYIVLHTERLQEMGKSRNCALCQTCKKRGCIKNYMAKIFKLARAFSSDCYESMEEKK